MTPGEVKIVVGDASSVSAFEREKLKGGIKPRSVEDLIRLLSNMRRNNIVYALFSRKGERPVPRLRRAGGGKVETGRDGDRSNALSHPVLLSLIPVRRVAADGEVRLKAKTRETLFVESPPQQIEARLNSLLAAHSIPRQDRRPGKVRAYDLRPLIQELRMIGQRGGMYIIAMRLQAGQQGTGRPDEVIDALGLSEALRAIDRVRLICKRT